MRRVISAKTAAQVTEMMVYAAPDRPNWIDQNYTVAGKTGTAQIASQTGGYREEGTIASYIGFAPAENPKFVMLVKLVEPKLSQWGATTAVPIWYEVADKIILRL
jgi:cell division protein FtsI/penicillin-binding protein 2